MKKDPHKDISPISCIIVDDEAFAGNLIADMVKDIPYLDLKCVTTSPLEGLRLVATDLVELVFLDMGMAELHGLDFLKATRRARCRTIITTAYPEFALDGYEYDVIDYLVKPVDFAKLVRASQKALQLLRGTSAETQIKWVYLKKIEDKNSRNDRVRVNVSDILCIEAQRNKIVVYTEQETIISHMALQNIQEMLPGDMFMQVHRSFIVSLTKIYKIWQDIIFIKGNKEIEIPIGPTYRKEFYRRI